MQIVRDGVATAALVIGREATWLERHAAQELRRYVAAMSGATLRIVDVPPASGPLVLIGRAETNPLVAAAVRQGIVRLSADDPGFDGFIVQTGRMDGRDIVVLGGSMDRGTLYAVYALLEDVLGVGFFRGDDRIPSASTVEVPSLHVAERPRFPERGEQNGCIFGYSASAWDWQEWRRELDWKAKRRVNVVYPFNVGAGIVQTILAEWGVPGMAPSRPAEPTLHERAHAYARQLGTRVPCVLPNGQLPDAFFRAFPDCRVLVTQWSELAPSRQLHPGDPLLRRLIADYIRHYRERYGSDHLYIAEFASESRILEGAENVQEARLDYARTVSAALKEADPEGVWIPCSWSFDLDAHEPAQRWSLDDVRTYLDAITVPHVVWDLWSEEAEKYLRTDYFFGHPWLFGVLHSFGGTSYLHGDVRDLIDRVHAIDADPKAAKCEGFVSLPEIIDYNGFYLELCEALSWNPAAVTTERWVKTWCRRRYGRAGASIEPAWRLLLACVYGPNSGSVGLPMDPLYWLRPDLDLCQGWPEERARFKQFWPPRKRYIPKLRRAVDIFLAQDDLLKESPLARHDLVDIARQWNIERFNQALIRARDAFLRGSTRALDRNGEAALRLLDDQARLLASWPPYRLDRKIERERVNYGDDATRATKHMHVWVFPDDAHEPVPLRDYYRLDLDGLVADYYRPRVAAFLDVLRTKLLAGEKDVTEKELDAVYRPIEDAFIAAPMRRLPVGEDPIAIVRELRAADR